VCIVVELTRLDPAFQPRVGLPISQVGRRRTCERKSQNVEHKLLDRYHKKKKNKKKKVTF
jgi:hypothetical protein